MPRKKIPVPVPPGSKYCHGCRNVHPLSGFHRNGSQPDGLASQCKDCAKAAANKTREMHKVIEEGLADMREYFRRNPNRGYEPPVPPMSVANR